MTRNPSGLRARVQVVVLFVCIATLASLAARPAGASPSIIINGDVLTATTDTLVAVFRGPDLFRLSNRLTKEQYLYPAMPFRSSIEMGMVTNPRTPLHGDFWRQGKNDLAAQWVMNDAHRAVYVNVVIDPDTQDLTMTLWSAMNTDGPTHLTWGMRGLDLTNGSLIVPAHGGRCLDLTSRADKLSLPYPSEWEAHMAIWQNHLGGGFVVYSRDTDSWFKDLRLTRMGDRADVAFVTEARGPWQRAADIPAVEWRINVFKGDWRVPAAGYANLQQYLHQSRPLGMAGSRGWARAIRTVVTLQDTAFDPKELDALAARLDPKRTLLDLQNWRKDGYNANDADYSARDGVHDFVQRAHALGFHIMTPIEPPGWNPASADNAAVRRYLVRDVVAGERVEDPRPTFAAFDTAATRYRSLLLDRVSVMIADVQPDALFLPGLGRTVNGGNGPIEEKNPAQGAITLCRALLTQFPDVALGSDGINEQIAPYVAFARVSAGGSLTPHPITLGLFGSEVFIYGDIPDADVMPEEATRDFAEFEGQGLPPSVVVPSAAALTGHPGLEQQLALAQLWQQHDLQADWTADWSKNAKATRFHWKGADGVVAEVTIDGKEAKLTVGDKTVYRRTHGATTLVTSLFVNGWAAYDEGALFGLDPATDYWLTQAPRPADAVHLSALGTGAALAAAEITPSYAVFDLAPARPGEADQHVTARVALPQGTRAVACIGAGTGTPGSDGVAVADLPLPSCFAVLLKPAEPASLPADLAASAHVVRAMASGLPEPAEGRVAPATCDGAVKERALTAAVPAGGRTVWTWYLHLPDGSKPTLAFAGGLPDGSDATVRLSARANGETVWSTTAKAGAWKSGSADLSKWAGKDALIQLVAESVGGARVPEVAWADVALR